MRRARGSPGDAQKGLREGGSCNALLGWWVTPGCAAGRGLRGLPRGAHAALSCPSQKRDIQLLKAYMRAIRSVNPNLQNLEETIEYNEILE